MNIVLFQTAYDTSCSDTKSSKAHLRVFSSFWPGGRYPRGRAPQQASIPIPLNGNLRDGGGGISQARGIYCACSSLLPEIEVDLSELFIQPL